MCSGSRVQPRRGGPDPTVKPQKGVRTLQRWRGHAAPAPPPHPPTNAPPPPPHNNTAATVHVPYPPMIRTFVVAIGNFQSASGLNRAAGMNKHHARILTVTPAVLHPLPPRHRPGPPSAPLEQENATHPTGQGHGEQGGVASTPQTPNDSTPLLPPLSPRVARGGAQPIG